MFSTGVTVKFKSLLLKPCFLKRFTETLCSAKPHEEATVRKRLLRVALIGSPNVGKSTLINRLVDRRVVAMSKKVHTTRCQARAVHVEGNTQIVFLDTPGVVSLNQYNRYKLEPEFLADGEIAVEEADVVGVVHDVSVSRPSALDQRLLRILHLYPNKESFLILNKIDTIKSKRKLLDLCTNLTGGKLRKYEDVTQAKLSEWQVKETISKGPSCWTKFSDVFMVSALLGHGIDGLKRYLVEAAKEDQWIYDAEVFTDQSDVKLIEDTVKSKLLDYLPNEIPYSLNVQLEYLDVQDPEFLRAVVLIYCKTEKIEKLVLGGGGFKIRQVAKESEDSLADTFLRPVALRLVTKPTSAPKLPKYE